MQHPRNAIVLTTLVMLVMLSAICVVGQRKPDEGKAVKPDHAPAVPVAEDPPEGAKMDKYGVYIDQRPLNRMAKIIADAGGVLSKPFRVAIGGTLGRDQDGKTVVLKKPNVVRSPDDPPNEPDVEKIVQDSIIAFGESGWLGYVEKMNAKEVVITVEQNDSVFVAGIRADQPTEQDAKATASGFSTILSMAVMQTEGDEQALLKAVSASTDGKAFLLHFEFPKTLAREMIARRLSEIKAGN